MKETPLSNCERDFVIQAIKNNQRLDGRKNDEFRNVKINFGSDWGSVLVALGETKVLAQVSCELGIPKATRPNEGMLYINVELGPMAASHFEAGRSSELTVQISRTLERTFHDSRCVDLESLCVTAEERVWVLRMNLNVLNHEGNLIDCCSLAALSALLHFKRPEVSIVEEEVRIHVASEKEPIPMVLHHYPVCVSYCTFNDGQLAVADPNVIEERTADSTMIFGLNSYRELCCLNLRGTTLTSSVLLLRCANRAADRAKFLVEYVKENLEADKTARETSKTVGLTESLKMNKITTFTEDRLALRLSGFKLKDMHKPKSENAMQTDEEQSDAGENQNNGKITSIGGHTAILQSNIRWVPDDDDDDDENNDIVDMYSENSSNGEDEPRLLKAEQAPLKKTTKQSEKELREEDPQSVDSDSEEEMKAVI